jgi:hypothetical protein
MRAQDLPDVDYSRDKYGLYESFTVAAIKSTHKFWPALLPPWATNPVIALPSWVPDMNFQAENPISKIWTSLTEIPLQSATSDSRVNVDLLQDSKAGTITLQGKTFAKIVAKSQSWPKFEAQPFHDLQILVSWIRFSVSPEDLAHPYDRDRGIFSSLEEFMVMILLQSGQSAHSVQTGRKKFLVWDWLVQFPSESASQETLECWLRLFCSNKTRLKFLVKIGTSAAGSAMLRTSTGHLGRTYGCLEPGDTIALLAGSDVPVILRPEGENWHFIAPAYVAGIMNGEAWPQDGNTDELETFVLI